MIISDKVEKINFEHVEIKLVESYYTEVWRML